MIIDGDISPNKTQYDKNEIIRFWNSMEALLNPNQLSKSGSVDNSVANSCLVNFLKVSTDKYKDLITGDKDIYRLSLILTESQIFTKYKDFCISKLLSLLNIDLLELNMKFIISYILLFEIKKNLNSIELILKYQGFTVIYNTLYTQFAYLSKYDITTTTTATATNTASNFKGKEEFTEIDAGIINEMKQICTVLMDIMYQIFKYCKCSISNVQIIDDFFVHFLITTIRSDTLDDLFNNSEFKLVLAINEQYIMFNREYNIENKVLKYVINNNYSTNKIFSELLLLTFNRSEDSSLQIMMCKLLYLILSNKSNKIAENFFYLNDLNVLVDVLIRELHDISDQNEFLRNTFLRILILLLKNTELNKTHYRRQDLMQLLNYLCMFDNICSNDNITSEHTLTVKLASKCLNEIPWLNDIDCINKEITEQNINSKTAFSMSSMSMNIPTVINRRKTDDSEISSMSSSNSVSSVNLYNNNNNNENKRYMYRNSLLQLENSNQFYNISDEISAESLWERKNKPTPPPPPPRLRKSILTASITNNNSNTNSNSTDYSRNVN